METQAQTLHHRRVQRIVRGVPVSDGAGVRLTRLLGSPRLDMLDPFLLLDEFRSDQPGDYGAGFPDHPHRGFETVTYMLAGRMLHADNHGNRGRLEPGGVQWMTAGRGLVHSEMPEQEAGLLWGFQLWVNLPAAEKMREPRYQDIPAADVPEIAPATGVRVRVVAGKVRRDAGSAGNGPQGAVEGPVRGVSAQPLFLDVSLAAGARWTAPVPAGHTGFAYVFEGEAILGDDTRVVSRGELATLSQGRDVALSGGSGGRLLLLAARPLGEPVARHGPFVMSTRAELAEAFEDYRAGRF